MFYNIGHRLPLGPIPLFTSFSYLLTKGLYQDQSYKHFTCVNYDSRVVITRNLLIVTTLETNSGRVVCSISEQSKSERPVSESELIHGCQSVHSEARRPSLPLLLAQSGGSDPSQKEFQISRGDLFTGLKKLPIHCTQLHFWVIFRLGSIY